MLGAGLYFGDAASTAAQYTTCGGSGTRMMLICTVALGKQASFTKINTSLTQPPKGYLSGCNIIFLFIHNVNIWARCSNAIPQ